MSEQLWSMASIVLTALAGYFVWNLQDRKKRQHEHDQRQNTFLVHMEAIERKMDDIVDIQKDNAEAISLSLESDIIQFRAFRKEGRLNGDSERQEAKINAYMLAKSRSQLEHKELGKK